MARTPSGIVGNGNRAKHLMHYLSMEKIPYINWGRSIDYLHPSVKLSSCQTVLLLISDDSIRSFSKSNKWLHNRDLIHFSGSLCLENISGIHPLMTFSKDLYSLEDYRNIPFIGEIGGKSLKELIPGITNQEFQIPKDKKNLYHSLCVIGGNFTNILWQKAFKDFKDELDLPIELLKPYLLKTVENIINNPFNSLTGPIKRGDKKTIKRNVKALKSPLWKRIYKLFNRSYNTEIK